jgi:ParB-like nuclease domain
LETCVTRVWKPKLVFFKRTKTHNKLNRSRNIEIWVILRFQLNPKAHCKAMENKPVKTIHRHSIPYTPETDVPLFETESSIQLQELNQEITEPIPNSEIAIEIPQEPVDLPIADIIIDPVFQSRVVISTLMILEYCGALKRGAVFPPIIVVQDPLTGHLRVVDGFHRLLAYKRFQKISISAFVVLGDHKTALLLAVTANSTHGLRRSNADKNRSITLLFSVPEFVNWSDHAIAARLGVSNKTVAAVRRSLEAQNLIAPVAVRISRSGRTQVAAKRLQAVSVDPSGEIPSPIQRGSGEDGCLAQNINACVPADGTGIMERLRQSPKAVMNIGVFWVGESFRVNISLLSGSLPSTTVVLDGPNPDAQLELYLRHFLDRYVSDAGN